MPTSRARPLIELTELRDRLKAGLSGNITDADGNAGSSVSELPQKIKLLKAAQSVDAMPHRVRQIHSTAEEPVTARILRRNEEIQASGDPVEQDGVPTVEPASSLELSKDSSGNSTAFQQRIEFGRQRKDQALPPSS